MDVLLAHQYQAVEQLRADLAAAVQVLVIQVNRQFLVQLTQVAAVVVTDHQAESVVRLEAAVLALL